MALWACGMRASAAGATGLAVGVLLARALMQSRIASPELLAAVSSTEIIAAPEAVSSAAAPEAVLSAADAAAVPAQLRLPPRAKWRQHRALLGSAFHWARRSAPFFDCSDSDITAAYYYRWRVFFLHSKETQKSGWVMTEFLRPVGWSGPFGTINAAFGHHAADARWLRDAALLDNYSMFWFTHADADVRYTWWPAHAALERFKLEGRVAPLLVLYPHLAHEYWRWVGRSTSSAANGDVCMWQAAHDDGEENSVSFDGCRPTINAAMYGEAMALASIAELVLQREAAAAEAARFRADALRWRRALDGLWSQELEFHVTRTLPPPKARKEDITRRRTKLGCQYCSRPRFSMSRSSSSSSRAGGGGDGSRGVGSSSRGVGSRGVGSSSSSRGGDSSRGGGDYPSMQCPPRWPEGELVRVREIAGLSWPWYHGAAHARHAVAWRQLTDPNGFAAKWGVTTTERRHPCYNFSTSVGGGPFPTSWNGPVWPYESAKLGTALIRALHDAGHRKALRSFASISAADFYAFLAQYARMHTRGAARDVPAGEPFVGESFHGEDGYWLTRELLYQRKAGDRRRGDHYLHSSYADLVLSGLVGIHVENATVVRASAATSSGVTSSGATGPGRGVAPCLVVEPLIGAGQLAWFSASSVRVQGREVAVAFDADGTHFSEDGVAGLAVWLDGRLVAHAPTLQRLAVPL